MTIYKIRAILDLEIMYWWLKKECKYATEKSNNVQFKLFWYLFFLKNYWKIN